MATFPYPGKWCETALVIYVANPFKRSSTFISEATTDFYRDGQLFFYTHTKTKEIKII